MISGVSLFLLDAGENASSFLDSSAVTLVVTSIVVPLVLAIMNKYGLKPPTPPTSESESTPTLEKAVVEPASSPSLPTPPTASDSLVPHDFVGNATDRLSLIVDDMWRRLKALEDREDSWQKERAEIISQNRLLLKTNTTLGIGLHTFFAWVDEGANPPPPDISDEVREIVHLIVEKVDLDRMK